MSIGTEIVGRTRKTIQDKLEQIEYFQDQIVLIDDQKSLYDQAIFRLDNDLLGEIQIVNRALDDVKDAYQDRISVGCRTDLFWRVVGHTTATGVGPGSTPEQWWLKCTKMNVVGYSGTGTVGPGTIFTLYTGSLEFGSAGMTTYPLTSKYGFTTDFYHVWGNRIGPELHVEYDGESPADYPGDQSGHSIAGYTYDKEDA